MGGRSSSRAGRRPVIAVASVCRSSNTRSHVQSIFGLQFSHEVPNVHARLRHSHKW